ncbi:MULTISPECIES: aldose 1-epimerase family protein [unclassified Sphingomonas]|uniref:aldose 1-epimerase family protein n=1 Tax=Sphingomonas TaxID=13687 RepID=UPI0009647B4F|nr:MULTISPECIES: aldose 1-epimerase family protein [unclassified Sphingomonas]MBN8809952.1 aldose 1-epimerase family protein [Sphingomonas sp.]OJY50557.1 MAG: aldose epimerase [Sphingomonas sp. 67-41]
MIEIGSEALAAVINPLGAELWSLRDAGGRALMTDADPAFWAGRAPLLFPIVGRLMDDRYRLDGKEYALPQHGFARRQNFALIDQAPDRAVLRLIDNAETRAAYPFAFALDAAFSLKGATLAMDVTVTNTGDVDMPASFGFHPAFAWPLPYGAAKAAHRITFADEERGQLAAIVKGGWMDAGGWESPVEGQVLALHDALFERDALVWNPVRSQSLAYGAEGGPQLVCDFPDTPALGLWMKPGARYLCIEPWHGIADPHGFTGEIWDKPLMQRYAPGEARTFTMRVTLAG